jgi:hypothetical protein
MNRIWLRRFLTTAICAAACGCAELAGAEPPSYFPSYVLLRPPVAASHKAPLRGVYPGYEIPVQTQAYSYGWFGAAPRRHWSLHHGYYGHYTEWSAR